MCFCGWLFLFIPLTDFFMAQSKQPGLCMNLDILSCVYLLLVPHSQFMYWPFSHSLVDPSTTSNCAPTHTQENTNVIFSIIIQIYVRCKKKMLYWKSLFHCFFSTFSTPLHAWAARFLSENLLHSTQSSNKQALNLYLTYLKLLN